MRRYVYITLLMLTGPACRREVDIPVTADFSWELADNNRTVPVSVKITNKTAGADHYQWTFDGGEPAGSTQRNPGVILFKEAGAHKITLEAWNDDQRQNKTLTVETDKLVDIGFDAKVRINDFSPVQVDITNKTTGATTYKWTFEGGEPAMAEGPQPPPVTFATPGEHTITLVANNGSKDFTYSTRITVKPALQPAFNIIPSFEDEDGQAPLTAALENKTISGLSWQWSATGGIIDQPAAGNTSITFTAPGTYQVTLTASNGKENKPVTKSITVLPNTNLRTLKDIRLGISSAHSAIGCFYSTKLRQVFRKGDDLTDAGKDIDLVFFGINQGFSSAKFLSPDSAQYYTLGAIPGAMATRLVNVQESCSCGITFSAADFDNMTDDTPLRKIRIPDDGSGDTPFDNSVTPRIILFQTKDGRKGVISIKQFVQAGQQSYILADIKVQKMPV
ncbi:PKD domain-containing protein [Chitinophaga qingshengii]|uniref:PKD domain-containing protein n=1 Tax=Chitinophaga qingshengii TaxID=1569794 RepID=A0ABR7TQM6_9BACT|nr:PKD domain-containing protein [Chitinophaga qingshengii]MBC9932776.1 PKD domain-containing protein [Chitinophaga qingshengii]